MPAKHTHHELKVALEHSIGTQHVCKHWLSMPPMQRPAHKSHCQNQSLIINRHAQHLRIGPGDSENVFESTSEPVLAAWKPPSYHAQTPGTLARQAWHGAQVLTGSKHTFCRIARLSFCCRNLVVIEYRELDQLLGVRALRQ